MIERTSSKTETRRRSYFLAAATIFPFWFVDLALPGSSPRATLVVRAGWSGLFLVAALLARRLPGPVLDRVALGAAALSAVSMTLLAELTGGARSPYLYAFPLLPVLNAMVEPWDEGPTWTSGLCIAVGAGLVVLANGMGAGAAAGWIGGVAVSTTWGIRGQRALRASRRAAADASRLAAIGRLAAGVAHEINNPLAFAKANVHFLRDSLPPTPDADEQRAAADEALLGIERIRGIVQDLRGFARDDAEHRVPMEPSQLVDEAVRISSVHLRARVRLTRAIDEGLPTLTVPRGRVVQVLVNLLANAADALEERTDGEVHVSAKRLGARVVVAVEDNGPGVPPAQRQRLFEPFATTKAFGKGLGLGLALSREFVERMGGSLRYEDRAGGGARFLIELPMEVMPEPAAPAGEEAA